MAIHSDANNGTNIIHTLTHDSGSTRVKGVQEDSWKATADKIGAWILQSLGSIGEFVTTPLRWISNCHYQAQPSTKPGASTCAEKINDLQLDNMRKELRAFCKNDTATTKVLNETKLNRARIKTELLSFSNTIKKPLEISEVDDFLNKLNDLLVKINHKTEYNRCSSAEDISNDLEALLGSKVYQTLRMTNSSTIHLLQQLSYATFYTDAKGVMSEWSEQIKISEGNEYSARQDFNGVSATLEKMNKETTYYTHGPLWVLLYSKNAFHAYESKHFESSDAHQNNPSFVVEQPTHGNKKLRPQKYGPTPTSYNRWLACLDHLNGKGQREIMVCLKDTTGPEGTHQATLYSKTKRHRIVSEDKANGSQSLYFASIPYNMRSKQEVKNLIKNHEPSDGNFERNFMNVLCQDHLSDGPVVPSKAIQDVKVSEAKVRSETLDKKSNRFMIPKDFLSDAELKLCYQLTAEFFSNDPISDKATQEEKLQRALDMQRFLLNVIITRFENNCSKHAQEKGKEIASVSSPCKQDFDRGGITKMVRSLFNEVVYGEQTSEKMKFSEAKIKHSLTMATLRVNTYDYRKMDQGKLNDGISLLNAIGNVEKKLNQDGKNLQKALGKVFLSPCEKENPPPKTTQPINIPLSKKETIK